jgi:hypothetical protein
MLKKCPRPRHDWILLVQEWKNGLNCCPIFLFLKVYLFLFLSFFFTMLGSAYLSQRCAAAWKNIFPPWFVSKFFPWSLAPFRHCSFRRASDGSWGKSRSRKSRYLLNRWNNLVWMLVVVVPRGGSISNQAGPPIGAYSTIHYVCVGLINNIIFCIKFFGYLSSLITFLIPGW